MKRVTLEFSFLDKGSSARNSTLAALCRYLYPDLGVFGIQLIDGLNEEAVLGDWLEANKKHFPQTSAVWCDYKAVFLSVVDVGSLAPDMDYHVFRRFEGLLVGGARNWTNYTDQDLLMLREMVSDAVDEEGKVDDLLNIFGGYVAFFENRDAPHACFYFRDEESETTADSIMDLTGSYDFEIVDNDLERF